MDGEKNKGNTPIKHGMIWGVKPPLFLETPMLLPFKTGVDVTLLPIHSLSGEDESTGSFVSVEELRCH